MIILHIFTKQISRYFRAPVIHYEEGFQDLFEYTRVINNKIAHHFYSKADIDHVLIQMKIFVHPVKGIP